MNSIRSSRFDQRELRRVALHRELLAQAGPQAGALALLVVVEPGSAQAARPPGLDHRVDDGEGRVVGPRPAVGLDGLLARLADLRHQLHVQLVGELEHGRRVAGLRGGLLDRRGRDALVEHRDPLV